MGGTNAWMASRGLSERRACQGILGFSINNVNVEAACETASQLLEARKFGQYISFANPHSLVMAGAHPHFGMALRDSALLLPDGAGILLAGRVLGVPFRERVTGMDFFRTFSARMQAIGRGSYFFLGSSDHVLARLRKRLAQDYPAIRVAGTFSPPFKDEFDAADDAAMIAAVNAAQPDVLWVGMTAPKQETWIWQNRERLAVPLIGAIGAVFDFYAGTKKRAPDWVCDLGLEWLPRLIREPRRLWRRNFVSTPQFLAAILAQKLFMRTKHFSPGPQR